MNGAYQNGGPPPPPQGQTGFKPLEFSFGNSSTRKRSATQSCVECRRRKIKCNRAFPCEPCIERGDAATCEEFQREKADVIPGYLLIADFMILLKRMEDLEKLVWGQITSNGSAAAQSQLAALQQSMATASTPFLQTTPLGDSSLMTFSGSLPLVSPTQTTIPMNSQASNSHFQFNNAPPIAIPSGNLAMFDTSSTFHLSAMEADSGMHPRSGFTSKPPSEDEDAEAAMILEDLAFSRQNNVGRIQAQSIASPAAPLAPAKKYALRDLGGASTLPDSTFGRILVNAYIDRVAWYARCLHMPTFRCQWKELQNWQPSTLLDSNQLLFVALYAAVLIVGISTIDPQTRSSALGMSDDEVTALQENWWQLCQEALHKGDWTQNHSILSLQAIIVIGPYLMTLGRSESHWTLIGSAIKIGFNLGLSKLGPEPEGEPTEEQIIKRFGIKWKAVVNREVGRRVWYNLLENDILFSAEHGYTSSIHPSQNKTVMPSNIDDADLIGHALKAKSDNVYTETAALRQHLSNLVPLQVLTDEVNTASRVGYSMVVKAYHATQSLFDQRPIFFQDECDVSKYATDAKMLTQLEIERQSTTEGHLLRCIRLFRPFYPHSFKYTKYHLARSVSVDAARRIIEKAENTKRSSLLLMIVMRTSFSLRIVNIRHLRTEVWYLVYFAFAATMVLFLEFCHAQETSTMPADAEAWVNRGIAALKSYKNKALSSPGSLFENLMAARKQRDFSLPKSATGRSETLGKRKRSLTDTLSRIGGGQPVESPSSSNNDQPDLTFGIGYPAALSMPSFTPVDTGVPSSEFDDLLRMFYSESLAAPQPAYQMSADFWSNPFSNE